MKKKYQILKNDMGFKIAIVENKLQMCCDAQCVMCGNCFCECECLENISEEDLKGIEW